MGMMDYEQKQSSRELSEVSQIWREIKQLLGPNMHIAPFLFRKIKEGGEKLVKMKSYLNQPKETKVFKKVFEDMGITEPFTKSSVEEKEIHVAKRMKRLHLRF